ncbi:MAG: NAD(P)-dependent glycerol-3-phosphate dehydrogenase [Betaproteobacteria bacterium]|nr:NAD(P)-dependent glycerol-3-phosphate dehydrogenase [Betaproteobacteria bacterium]PWB59554.1 MAG: glycerol-3-phosphate dehydrogenase [Betaproteobacteria bacterium]
MRIAVLGAGAWGSALAISLCASHEVRLWARRREACDELSRSRSSPYLPEVPFPDALRVEPDLSSAISGCDLAVVATSTAGLRDTATAVAAIRPRIDLLWACKGFEQGSRKLPHEIVAEVLPGAARTGALSGPSFALEVARGQPTAIVLASRDAAFASESAAQLNSARLRIYSSADLVGVELGGAVKNVIAIAAGIADGLGLGRNARAALVTRGLAEIVRLGVATGGQPETFMGLTGLGDLVLTCTGELSRNRDVGLRLAKGQALPDILRDLGHVAEGVQSAASVRDLAHGRGIEMPITQAVCAVLFEGRPPAEAVRQLLARDPKAE